MGKASQRTATIQYRACPRRRHSGRRSPVRVLRQPQTGTRTKSGLTPAMSGWQVLPIVSFARSAVSSSMIIGAVPRAARADQPAEVRLPRASRPHLGGHGPRTASSCGWSVSALVSTRMVELISTRMMEDARLDRPLVRDRRRDRAVEADHPHSVLHRHRTARLAEARGRGYAPTRGPCCCVAFAACGEGARAAVTTSGSGRRLPSVRVCRRARVPSSSRSNDRARPRSPVNRSSAPRDARASCIPGSSPSSRHRAHDSSSCSRRRS